jgi:hypothetical protein
MVRLQHKIRRSGGITVGTTRYALDERGVVEVSDEDAKKLQQGAMWAAEGTWDHLIAAAKPPEGGPGGRLPRTREQLEAAAGLAGVKPPPPKSEPVTEPLRPPGAPRTVTEEDLSDSHGGPAIGSEVIEPEPLEVSMDNTRAQLVSAAGEMGVDVPKAATKAQILELIEAQAEE